MGFLKTLITLLPEVGRGIIQCRTGLVVMVLLYLLLTTGQGSELLGSLFDSKSGVVALFTCAGLLLLSLQVWFWSRLRLELLTAERENSLRKHQIEPHRQAIVNRVAPLLLAAGTMGTQIYHLWQTQRFGVIVLVGAVCFSVMIGAIASFGAPPVNAIKKTSGLLDKENQGPGFFLTSMNKFFGLRKDEALGLPFWQWGVVLAIGLSLATIVGAIFAGPERLGAFGAIGVVYLGLAWLYPLIALPRLVFRNSIWPVTALLWSIPLLAPLALARFPRGASTLTPIAFVVMAAAVLAALLAYLAWQRRFRDLALLVIVATISSAAISNSGNVSHQVVNLPRTAQEAVAPLQTGLSMEAESWWALQERQGRRTSHIYFVNAAGGGIRAAYWTAQVLGRVTDCNGRFVDSLFGISGVSGGSLGAVVYLAQLANRRDPESGERLAQLAPSHCNIHPLSVVDVPLLPGQFQVQAKTVLSHDFLSPTLAGLFFNDVIASIIPAYTPDERAGVFEAEIARAWRPSCDEVSTRGGFECQIQNLNKLSFFDLRPFDRQNINNRKNWYPLLLLNGTHQETGKRIITSHFKIDTAAFPDTYDFFRDMFGADFSAATAVLNSARFPIVSPSGVIIDHQQKTFTTRGHVIDGGYFENNGALTIEEFVDATMEALKAKMPEDAVLPTPVVIEILNDPAFPAQSLATWNELPKAFGIEIEGSVAKSDASTPALLAQLAGALQGIYQTSGARGTLASKSLASKIRKHPGVFVQFRLCPGMKVPPPLGWLLTPQTQSEMDVLLLGRKFDDARSTKFKQPGTSPTLFSFLGAPMSAVANIEASQPSATYAECFDHNQNSLARILSLLAAEQGTQ